MSMCEDISEGEYSKSDYEKFVALVAMIILQQALPKMDKECQLGAKNTMNEYNSGFTNGYWANCARINETAEYLNSFQINTANREPHNTNYENQKCNKLIESCKTIYRLDLTKYEKIRLIGKEIDKYFDEYRQNHMSLENGRDEYGRLKRLEPLGKQDVEFAKFEEKEIMQRLLVIYQLDLPPMLINILLGEEVIKSIERGKI